MNTLDLDDIDIYAWISMYGVRMTRNEGMTTDSNSARLFYIFLTVRNVFLQH